MLASNIFYGETKTPRKNNTMAKKQTHYFYTVKALMINLLFTVVVCIVGILIYQFTQIETLSSPPATITLVAATVFSIIAGFSILIAFTRFQDFKSVIAQETACLGDLLDLIIYIQGQDFLKQKIISKVKEYGVSVANDEWKNMDSGQPNINTSIKLKSLMDSINDLDLANNKNQIIFESFIDRITSLTTSRANRIKKAKEQFPQLLTITLYVVSINFIVSIFFLLIPIPNLFLELMFLSIVVFISSLIIQLVQDMGNPYRPGVWSVSKDDYEKIKTSIIN